MHLKRLNADGSAMDGFLVGEGDIVSKFVMLRAFAGGRPAPASRLGYAPWRAALVAAGCLLVLGGWAVRAVADQSVIDLMNKTAAQKAAAQSAPAPEAAATKPAARPKAGAKAPAAKAPAKPTPTPVPRPEQALLEPQGAPDCAFRGPVSSPITADELR